MYRTFIRTWWRNNPSWPNGLEPHPGRKNYTGHTYQKMEEARAACAEYSRTNNPGKLSRKMEFESF